MADTITLRVDHFDSPFGRSESTATVPTPTATADAPLTSVRIERLLDGLSGAEVTVRRSDWVDILPHISSRDDRLFLEQGTGTLFGGRLVDWQFDGEFATVQLNDFEIDALTADPIGNIEEVNEPGVVLSAYPYENVADSTVVSAMLEGDPDALVNGVPTLSAGTIETVGDDVTVTESFAFPGDIIQSLLETTGARVEYNADQTVDYVARLGTDRSETLTSEQLIAPPRVRSATDQNYSRVFAFNPSATDNGDVQSFSSEVIDEQQRQLALREQTDASGTFFDSGITSAAVEKAAEIDAAPSQTLVEATVDPSLLSTSLALDDTIRVDFPEYRVTDERLRVLKRTRELGAAGDTLRVKLSNRRFTSAI